MKLLYFDEAENQARRDKIRAALDAAHTGDQAMTPIVDSPELLPVEQVDREAAAEWADKAIRMIGFADRIRSGKTDYEGIVQAFARHRFAAVKDHAPAVDRKFQLGDIVTKVSGASWNGTVVGFYSTKLTPIGYAVESLFEAGSVQIYPETALRLTGVALRARAALSDQGDGR